MCTGGKCVKRAGFVEGLPPPPHQAPAVDDFGPHGLPEEEEEGVSAYMVCNGGAGPAATWQN